jgi:hypothetical protein
MGDPDPRGVTVQVIPHCFNFIHFHLNKKTTCDALPDGIPDDIYWNRFDHRKPHGGDHGVRYELGEPRGSPHESKAADVGA